MQPRAESRIDFHVALMRMAPTKVLTHQHDAIGVKLEREAELRAVREVIDSLREGPEKETVRLFYLEGTLSAREIALRMGVGKSAVTMRLERFRAKIRAQLCERLAG